LRVEVAVDAWKVRQGCHFGEQFRAYWIGFVSVLERRFVVHHRARLCRRGGGDRPRRDASAHVASIMLAMLWDIFCRVIDNHGDVGVCWRLAADLASRGERVRLWIDDASALAWMAPGGSPGVEVLPWDQAIGGDAQARTSATGGGGVPLPGDVVIEAFGCELPEDFIRRMVAAPRTPMWINLEYLSAESYVEQSHALPSPQPSGLRKVFFYPGFTARTGGLLREPDVLARRDAFDAPAWLDSRACRPAPGERVVSLFCYEQPGLARWLEQLSGRPTLLLATTGFAAAQVRSILGPEMRLNALRSVELPPLGQRDYDHLLWSSDFNCVRGEDSFVRAQWAAKPFVWQIYPQDGGAHFEKLEAFLALYLVGADPALVGEVRSLWRAWNGSSPDFGPAHAGRNHFGGSPSAAWRAHAVEWCARLALQPDLTTQLIRWVRETR
jgi:uncharacterized repeat protein (TIGR03837 family)